MCVKMVREKKKRWCSEFLDEDWHEILTNSGSSSNGISVRCMSSNTQFITQLLEKELTKLALAEVATINPFFLNKGEE